MRKVILACVALLLVHDLAFASDVEIGVLGLFHPQAVIVSPSSPEGMSCTANGQTWPLRSPMKIERRGSVLQMVLDGERVSPALLTCAASSGPARFSVAVPGKISRTYEGSLAITASQAQIQVVIRMDLETAVASVTAAESLPNTPLQALKAQAIAARSFLSAGKGRHKGFDFCDTTHCQFLRQPPPSNSPAWAATRETQGLVLTYQQNVFAAMYSASCSGKTHTLDELGIPVRDYPYYSVICDYCHRHPHAWTSNISTEDAANLQPGENGRLRLARQLGWKTVLSNSYTTHAGDGEVILEGVGVGHGLGLCQRGAADMARRGASWEQILQHYYPNTVVIAVPQTALR